MSSSRLHYFHTDEMDWERHETISSIRIKILESRDTHPTASFNMMRVRLEAGGLIETHVHEYATETAYVLAGQGVLIAGDESIPLTSGSGISIPPGLPHSLQNVGEESIELIAIHTPPVL